MQNASGIEQVALQCPGADSVLQQLAQMQIDRNSLLDALIYSVAEMADAGSVSYFEIILDTRQLGQTSLLHTKFVDYQGPALCFYIPGRPSAPGSQLQFQACALRSIWRDVSS